ncbi:MAG: bifunctional 3,4-dihydroxy-2-butanone-4-phosphate synthase/GTP cyclohydrolase II [Proteobacteria bacterium]|nr:bifunctional 3,4-dihydroxy-2-butanone-4-phosphate synthase/GTP cyclohydrolase II [Pseudomonadota bacterium]
MSLNTTSELIEEIRDGRMVILMDDEDRENEGDLIIAASCVRSEDINFMARFGRGLICLTLTGEHCRKLNLPLMNSQSNINFSTNFTVSIEAAEGVTTGISAADRALTIQKAVAPNAKSTDLIQPGHVFPLMAQPGGVLSRAGHTEAGCDLARLAGLQAATVIVEILNDDGSMARRPDLEKFAREHGLKIGTIADLIRYRIENEKTVEHMTECTLPTEYGEFVLHAYQDKLEKKLHLALVKGKLDPDKPTLVRVHLENPISDLTGSLARDRGWPIDDVLKRLADEETGVLVILCNQYESMELINQIESYKTNKQQTDTKNSENSRDLRTIGLGAQILSDLGVRKMRVLSAPKRIHALSGFGLEVVEYVN